MGYTKFLFGAPGPSLTNLPHTIEELQNLSTIFMSRWARRQMEQAGEATKKAMVCFDYIVGEIMRSRENRKSDASYIGSSFEARMNGHCGLMIAPASLAEHRNVKALGPGNGALPPNRGAPIAITLEKTLLKVKHRSKVYGNFRIDGDRHILLICPENTSDGSPESVVEFDVGLFCNECRELAALL